jgi:ABC-type transport system involved in multi-copper enzyme maturation permease subunit
MIAKLQRIQAVARLILLDGVRRHALIGLVVLALALQCGGLFFFGFIPRDIGRASSDFIFSVSWFSGMIFLFFHAVQAMAWGEERRVIHTLLARPISRGEYVLGVFAGLATLLFLLNLLLGGLGWGVLNVIRSLVVADQYFKHFSFGYFLLTWAGIYLVELTILSVIMLFSGMVRGNFTVLLMTISYYFICNGLPVVRQTLTQRPGEGDGASALLRWATALFPDFSRVDYKLYVVSGADLPAVSLLLSQYGVLMLYSVLALWVACIIYRKRDLK